MKNFLAIAILLCSLDLPAVENITASRTSFQEVCAYISAGYWHMTGFAIATQCVAMAFHREFEFQWPLYTLILGTGNSLMFSMFAGDEPLGSDSAPGNETIATR